MKNETIALKDYYKVQGGTLTTYVIDKPLDDEKAKWCRPAVIVVPGGAYYFCSKRESEIVALEFLARGYNVFLLNYMCSPEHVHYPEQLLELAVSVDYVKKNAKKLSVNPKEIFAVGFSAGGHLVASLSTDYTIAQSQYEGKIDPKLTAAGLIYPVISDQYGHTDSHENLFMGVSDTYKESKIELTRMDCRVSDKTAPAYIFSTYEDTCVPSMNALMYAKAMAENKLPYELHVYKNGNHGMSTASAEINDDNSKFVRNQAWMEDCSAFFRDYVKEKF